jgi:hypothetical protein
MVSEPLSSERPPSTLRSAAVTMGPSLLVDLVAAVCTITTLRRLLRRPNGRGFFSALCALGAAAPWAYLVARRPWVLNWGARLGEIARILPGDEIVSEPAWVSTRAVSIAAPREAVWPWLVQMGQDKGGLYSYAWLENLAGLRFHNADRVHPEWQDVAVGDIVRFAPGQDTLTVARIEPNHVLVWQILDPRTGRAAPATWAFVLEPEGPEETRLIQRFRIGGTPRRLVGAAYTLMVEIPHFIMERAMLRGIRARAERAWRAR